MRASFIAPVGIITIALQSAPLGFTIESPMPGQLPEPTSREAQIDARRLQAQERIDKDRLVYSTAALEDIESRYRSAHHSTLSFAVLRNAAPILRELIAKYPESNRAGCATLELAQLSDGAERERYLQQAIVKHADTWFETGVQVGPLAQARLAIHYASLDRFAEAEQLAADIAKRFPGAVDPSGAPLDLVVKGLKLLRPPK